MIDASDPSHEEHEKVVLDLLKSMDMLDIPRLSIYNKMDKVKSLTATAFPNVRLSSKDKNAKQYLRSLIIDEIREVFEPFTITVNQQAFYKLYHLEKVALLDHYDLTKEIETISGYIASKNKWKLEEFYD